MSSPLLYQVAISLIPGIGSINAKKLIAYTGSVEGIFKEKKSNLLKVPGIGDVLAKEIVNANVFDEAAKELEFIEKYNIQTYFYLEEKYPARLKNCEDSPLLLYVKGTANLNAAKTVCIVGTRNATDYGKNFTDKLIKAFADSKHNPLIISGLAYGIDIAAHKAALKYGLETIGVMAHGMKHIYPATHSKYAREMVNQGALVTEFTSDTKADRAFFVRRNRIAAGLSDATIVIESGEEGGALITADLANSYNRDVFAVPGRVDDPMSKGCHKLIKANKAALLESFEDIEYLLGWEKINASSPVIQRELFVNLTDNEQHIYNILQRNGEMPIDILCVEAEMPVSKVSPLLLSLEFAGHVRSLPGKVYKVN